MGCFPSVWCPSLFQQGLYRCINMASGTTHVDGKVFFREGGTEWAGTLANMSAVGENLNELAVE